MQAYRLFAPAPIETRPLVPIDLPLPEPGQVRIKISVCGVCHTDLHIVEGDIAPAGVVEVAVKAKGQVDARVRPGYSSKAV